MQGLAKMAAGAAGVMLAARPEPVAGPGEAVVDVAAVGICGTDLHIMNDEYPSRPPVTMGHEITGTVSAVGSPSDKAWLGRRVAVETYFRTCERCSMCRAGRRNLCARRDSLGSMVDGGFARQVLVPAINLHAVPANVSELAGALAEPLACVAQCLVVQPSVRVGDTVLVVGPGPMGFLAAQVARAQGAAVTVSGLPADSARLAVCAAAGFDVLDARPAEDSFDVAVECSGSGGGATVAMRSARRGGRYVGVGIFGRDVTVPLDLLLYKELVMSSGFASTPQSWETAIRLMASGALDLDAVVTGSYPLERWEEAFEVLKSGSAMKVMLDPR